MLISSINYDRFSKSNTISPRETNIFTGIRARGPCGGAQSPIFRENPIIPPATRSRAGLEVGKRREKAKGKRKKRGGRETRRVCVCSNARYTSVRVLCRELKEKRWHRPGHNIVPDDINELLQRLNRSVAVAFVTRK